LQEEKQTARDFSLQLISDVKRAGRDFSLRSRGGIKRKWLNERPRFSPGDSLHSWWFASAPF
jgi:hypothetical protein